MFGIVAIGIALAAAIILGKAAMQPDRYRVERSAVIDAPPAQVLPHLADFHKWRAWSPWEELDPNLKRTFSGAESGKGAVYEWEGNKKAGSGRMEITDVTPNRVVIQLDFLTPFEAHNVTEIDLKERTPGVTEVVWAMHGPQPFMFKMMKVFMNMDEMVGKDFTKGLAQLKAVVEGRGATAAR